jgi:paraquat-inducible protein A
MTSGARSFFLGVLIVAATVCLVLGLTLPIVRFTRFYVWTDVHSMVSIITELYKSQEIFLAAVICLFSVGFPFVKLVYLLALYSARDWDTHSRNRFLRRLAWLGKWSMLDVLVLALVIFYVKSTKFADAVSMPGIYMFAAAVVLTMLAYGIVEHDTEIADVSEPPDEKTSGGGIHSDYSGLRPVLSAAPRARLGLRAHRTNPLLPLPASEPMAPASLARKEGSEGAGLSGGLRG